MTAVERVLQFDCAGETLIGVLSLPPPAPSTANAETAVLIVVGGPQYRAGSHRQFTLLCRALAAGGFPALRFDYRGMGDSGGPLPAFESTSADIEAAIGALQRARPSVRHVVLWGLCDGASAALLYLHERRDARVTALCLVNPWVRSPESLASAQVRHYYVDRILQRDFWDKLLRGGIGLRAVAELVANARLARRRRLATPSGHDTLPFQQRMALAWREFRGPLLLLLSGQDLVAREFCDQVRDAVHWRGALGQVGVARVDLHAATHTFSESADARRAEAATLEWLQQFGGRAEPG